MSKKITKKERKAIRQQELAKLGRSAEPLNKLLYDDMAKEYIKNAKQMAKVSKKLQETAEESPHRDPKVKGLNFAFPRTDGENIAFLNMLNAFRDEYFKGNSPYDVSLEEIKAMGKKQGVFRNMFYWEDELIAISESCLGSCHGKTTIGVGTVYVKPSWRGQGIASNIYDFVENTLTKNVPECAFNLQIECDELKANIGKFIALGFTHAFMIEKFTNGMKYQQPTFALFKGKQLDGSTCLRSMQRGWDAVSKMLETA